MERVVHIALATLALTLQLSACSGTTHSDAHSTARLYDALGGEQGIHSIVDSFLYALADNELALPLFAHTDIERFREQFATQLCEVADGPCSYQGDSMQATHRGMNIDHAQFNSVVEDLIWAMEQNHIGVTAQNGLLARLAAMYEDISYR